MSRFRIFLTSAIITLFCLIPIYMLVIGISGVETDSQAVAGEAQNVSKLSPTQEDTLTLLLVPRCEQTVAAMIRLDAWENRGEIMILPENTLLPVGEAEQTLKEAYDQRGPLQLRSSIEQLTGIDFERYLAPEHAALIELFRGVTPTMHWDELGQLQNLAMLRRFAYNGGQGTISAQSAALLLTQENTAPSLRAQLAANLFGAFLQQALSHPPLASDSDIAAASVEWFRSDQQLLTDISAVDIYGVERLFRLLMANPPEVTAQVVPGKITPQGYVLSSEGIARMTALLSPTQ